jgi:hypothetical protein
MNAVWNHESARSCGKTSNIQHNIERPTSNEWFEDNHWKFDVGRSTFDVSFNNPPYRSSALQSGLFALVWRANAAPTFVVASSPNPADPVDP